MPSSVTYESATLADAVQKAARVAPGKGSAFDKAAGILFDVNTATGETIISATDLDSTYVQTIQASAHSGDSTKWRCPSRLLADMVSSLPLGQDQTVTLIDRPLKDEVPGTWLRVSAGKFKAKIALMNAESFPIMPDFDPQGMQAADDLSQKVAQVSWSVSKEQNTPLAGVRIDGTRLVGCCPYTVAVVPCEVPVDEGVTVPLDTLSALLKTATGIRMRVADERLELMLDAETKATSRIIPGDYPNIDMLLRKNFQGSIAIGKAQFIETLNSLTALIRADRQPKLDFTINGTSKTLTFDIDLPEVGRMQNTIDIATTYDDEFTFTIKPDYILPAVSASRSEIIHLHFGNSDNPARGADFSVRVDDTLGYECYVMPIRK